VVTARDVILASKLDGGLRGLRATGHQVEARVVDGRAAGQLLRQALRRLRGELAAVHVGQRPCLVGDGLGDLGDAVTDVDDERAPGGVEEAAAVRVPDPDTIPPDGGGEPPARPLPVKDRHVGETLAKAGVLVN